MHLCSSLTELHRTLVGAPDLSVQACMGQGQGLFMPHSLEILSARCIVMGHEILGIQPAKPGRGIPPTKSLMLGKGQPECHHLPLGIVQGLGIGVALPHDAFSHGDPPTSSDFFPPVGVASDPICLHQDALAGVVH